jgi:hypothetical protein
VKPDSVRRIAGLLHEAAETHHVVYRITDSDDPDWVSWCADWLLDLSELAELLGVRPVRSHLVHALVELDREFTAAGPDERWEDWYAARRTATHHLKARAARARLSPVPERALGRSATWSRGTARDVAPLDSEAGIVIRWSAAYRAAGMAVTNRLGRGWGKQRELGGRRLACPSF